MQKENKVNNHITMYSWVSLKGLSQLLRTHVKANQEMEIFGSCVGIGTS